MRAYLLISIALASSGCRQLFGLEDITLPIDAAPPPDRYIPDVPDAPGDAFMLPVMQQAYIKASNTNASDLFGKPIALSADGLYLAIGAPGEDSAAVGIGNNQADENASASGAVYIFAWSGTAWVQQAYVKASNTQNSDAFGTSVALSTDGSTLAVGAPGEDSAAVTIGGLETDNNASGAGAVYVFTRVSTTWAQQAYVKPFNTNSLDAFGTVVALSGDGNTLAVGAPGEDSNAVTINGLETDNSASGAGAAYVFTRATAVWSQEAYIKASNTGVGGDQLGSAIALSSDGNTLAVGAPQEGSLATGVGGNEFDNSAFGAGAVYVYTRLSTTWTQQAYVKASNTRAADNFGTAVSLSGSGSMLAVGAPSEDNGSTGIDGSQSGTLFASNSGSVYVLSRSGATWSQEAYVKASNTDSSDDFGRSVALSPSGLHLAVGAPNEDSIAVGVGGDQTSDTASASGAVYLFFKVTAWSQGAYIKASNSEATDHFGSHVQICNDVKPLVVGSPDEDSIAVGVGGNQADNTLFSAGAAYSLRTP